MTDEKRDEAWALYEAGLAEIFPGGVDGYLIPKDAIHRLFFSGWKKCEESLGINNCHSTMLLEEMFSIASIREGMTINHRRRVRKHLAKVKLMGAG